MFMFSSRQAIVHRFFPILRFIKVICDRVNIRRLLLLELHGDLLVQPLATPGQLAVVQHLPNETVRKAIDFGLVVFDGDEFGS